jgi:hypothetical protein
MRIARGQCVEGYGQEFRFWLGPGSARALADPGEMPEAHEAASATGS